MQRPARRSQKMQPDVGLGITRATLFNLHKATAVSRYVEKPSTGIGSERNKSPPLFVFLEQVNVSFGGAIVSIY